MNPFLDYQASLDAADAAFASHSMHAGLVLAAGMIFLRLLLGWWRGRLFVVLLAPALMILVGAGLTWLPDDQKWLLKAAILFLALLAMVSNCSRKRINEGARR